MTAVSREAAEHIWKDPTLPSAPERGDDGSCSRYLIVLKKEGRIVAAHRPRKTLVTVGRSRRCDLRVEDPTFPGMAGEIIIAPVPLFRPPPPEGREKSSPAGTAIHRIRPGRWVRLGKFRMTLLDPGGVLANRKTPLRPLTLIGAMSLSILLAGTAGIIASGSRHRPAAATGTAAARNVSGSEEGAVPQGTPLPPGSGGVVTRTSSTAVTDDGQRRRNHGAMIPPAGVITHVSPTFPAEERERSSISEEAILKILAPAREAMTGDDIPRAKALLSPLIPLLSERQKESISSTLEPAAASLFSRAYMAWPYDHEETDRNMRLLGESGLTFLPSVRKALSFLGVRTAGD